MSPNVLCPALLIGTLVVSVVNGGVPPAWSGETRPVAQRCYVDCAGGCKIQRGGTDAAADEIYAPDRGVVRALTNTFGWTLPPPTAVEMLPELQKSGACPPATDPNPEPCRIHFLRRETFRGSETFYNVEAGEKHRVIASAEAAPDVLTAAARLRALGQCPNDLTTVPPRTNDAISTR